MKRLLAIGLLIVGTVSPRVGGTTAYMTSAVTSGSSAFSAATIDLDALASTGGATKSVLMSVSNVYPGLVTYDSVVIENKSTAGNASFLFGISADLAAGDRPLATAIKLAVISVPAVGNCGTEAGFTTYAGISANRKYGIDSVQPMVSSNNEAINIVGDTVSTLPTSGSKILLTPTNSSVVLCFRVTMPTSTSFEHHGGATLKTATVQFAFTAVQAAGLS